MKWIGVSGSWRKTCSELEKDIEYEVNKVLGSGNGIVAGGALGVDYAATRLALEHAPDGSKIKVFLPTKLEIYALHYRKRAGEGVITHEQAEQLISQLELVNSLGSLVVNETETVVDKRTYYLRDTEVVNSSDELIAFQVNNSKGTQDTIDKARKRDVHVQVFQYTVD